MTEQSRTMSKITPGEWHQSPDGVPEHHTQVTIYAENGGRVATVFLTQANADLIKAAPDLLAACEAQHKAIDHLFAMLVVCKPDFMPSRSGASWDALKQGTEAIAKAGGEG